MSLDQEMAAKLPDETWHGCILRVRAAASPDRLVAVSGDTQFTYGQIDAEATALSWQILERLGDGDHRVLVYSRDVHTWLVAMAAISRAGKIYVGADASIPVDRLTAMIADIDAALVIGDPLPAGVTTCQSVDAFGHPVRDDMPTVAPARCLSVTFTSGSTGTPKGVMRPWEGGLNLLRSYDGVAGPEHRIGRVLGGVATMFMNAIKTALLLGETYFFDAWASPPSDIPGWVDRHQLTVLSTVPSVLRTMLASAPAPASLASLDEVWLSGEPTTDQDARDLASVVPPTTVLTSSYASSEAAGMIDFVVTMADVDSGTVPWDTQVDPSRELVIVDRDGVPVPDGQLGEITVFSSSVSLGYWNRPAETAATFRPTTDGRTQVATGDAGVRHPDGRIELHGRVDRMVKVHGVRIELGEIEVALGEIDGVVHAAAVTYERRPGDVRLVAFAVLAPGTSIDGPALRRRLSTRLPRAMLPDGVVVIDELPLLPGGKVDRAALPPFTFTPVTSSVEPSTVLEAALLGVVRAETGIATAGIDDDLFFDLGVDSLAAAGIFAAFADDLDIDQPLTLLLEAPTVRALAAAIEGDAPPSPVTTFRRHGTQPPLIAVQGAYGSVLFARRLLDALDDEQPLYGVELAHDAAIGRIAPPTSLPTLARQHLDLLHAHGLTGPLRLFGYSFGGAVAYEMAWQIEQAGGEVDLLVLGDCPSFGIDDELPRTHRSPFSASMERQRFRALVRSGGARNLVSSLRLQRQRWLGARRRTAELKRHRRHGGTLAPSARDAYLEQVSMDLFSRWRPTGPLRAPGLYLDAARSSCRPPASSLFGGGLGIVSFECDHAGLVDGTTAPAVGQCIADECRRRRSADSSSTGQ